MRSTDKSDALYDAISDAVEKNKIGMTTYQIMGTLTSFMLRFWERNVKQGEVTCDGLNGIP